MKPREDCAWELDEHDGSYDTECGQKFVFIEGGPRENEMRFCCYCGGKLKVPASAAPLKE